MTAPICICIHAPEQHLVDGCYPDGATCSVLGCECTAKRAVVGHSARELAAQRLADTALRVSGLIESGSAAQKAVGVLVHDAMIVKLGEKR